MRNGNKLLLLFLSVPCLVYNPCRVQSFGVDDSSVSSPTRQPNTMLKAAAAASFDKQNINNNDANAATMLTEMTEFFASMVNPDTHRFYYLCQPSPVNKQIHQQHALRDLAAAWDATKAVRHWQQDNNIASSSSSSLFPRQESLHLIQNAIGCTVESYPTTMALVVKQDDDDDTRITTNNNQQLETPCRNSPEMLSLSSCADEPSNLGHSAMKLLACLGALRLGIIVDEQGNFKNNLEGLTQGILSLQQPNGAFATTFGSTDIYSDLNFYPGEAMVALMEVYSWTQRSLHDDVLHPSTRAALLPALERALDFYIDYYHQHAPDTNFHIWQIQAFARFFHACQDDDDDDDNNKNNDETATKAANYVVTLSRDIMNSKAWKYELARGRSFYPNLQTLEIACGLDALVDAMTVAMATQQDNDLLLLISRQVQNAVDFLHWSLERIPVDAPMGRGGLGYGGVHVMEQRLDVTGHAMSALTKLARVNTTVRA